MLSLKGTVMEATFLKKMKTSLFDLKQEILKNLASESEDFRTIIEDMDPKDLADIAADDIDRKTLEALGSQELRRLQLIESALARIENEIVGLVFSIGLGHAKAQARRFV